MVPVRDSLRMVHSFGGEEAAAIEFPGSREKWLAPFYEMYAKANLLHVQGVESAGGGLPRGQARCWECADS